MEINPYYITDQYLYEKLKDNIICKRCNEIFIEPLKCYCSHVVCKKCYYEIKKCPDCNKPNKFVSDSSTQKFLDLFSFRCQNEHMGCEKILKFNDYIEHIKYCHICEECGGVTKEAHTKVKCLEIKNEKLMNWITKIINNEKKFKEEKNLVKNAKNKFKTVIDIHDQRVKFEKIFTELNNTNMKVFGQGIIKIDKNSIVKQQGTVTGWNSLAYYSYELTGIHEYKFRIDHMHNDHTGIMFGLTDKPEHFHTTQLGYSEWGCEAIVINMGGSKFTFGTVFHKKNWACVVGDVFYVKVDVNKSEVSFFKNGDLIAEADLAYKDWSSYYLTFFLYYPKDKITFISQDDDQEVNQVVKIEDEEEY